MRVIAETVWTWALPELHETLDGLRVLDMIWQTLLTTTVYRHIPADSSERSA